MHAAPGLDMVHCLVWRGCCGMVLSMTWWLLLL